MAGFKKVLLKDDLIDDLGDVDTVSDAPVKDEALKWNGTNWVPAPYNYSFVFSIASFSDGEATTQLIGSGTWQGSSTMSYTASYSNGPPTTADVKMSINGGAYNDVGNMDATPMTTGTNYDGAISYPSARDQYLRFRLAADDGVDSDTSTETAIYFRNYLYWGADTKASGHLEADVEALSGSAISNSFTTSRALTPGASDYLVYAVPAGYTTLKTGNDYETDGHTSFTYNGIAVAMNVDTSTLSITNSAGYNENYRVYVSDNTNLGSHTLTMTTGNATIDPLYYGVTTTSTGWSEAQIEALANAPVTNDATQVWNEVTAGASEYLLFCFPKRLGEKSVDYDFYDYSTGFLADFQSAETVSVTNANGYTEDYYCYRSTYTNLGATTIETK